MSRSHPLRTAARRTFAVLALVAAPAAARAQYTGTVTYVGPATDAIALPYRSGNQTFFRSVGPAALTLTTPALPGQSRELLAFCVDLANGVTNNTTFSANLTSLGLAVSGQTTLDATRRGAAGLDGYKKAAFLLDQFQSAPVAGLTGETRSKTWGALHGAIWTLFTPSAPGLEPGAPVTDNTRIAYWQQQANDFAASGRFNTYDYSRFTIITDVNAAGRAAGGVQEFMTTGAVVPEPSTVLLLGGGLVAVAGAAARRRRGGAAGGEA